MGGRRRKREIGQINGERHGPNGGGVDLKFRRSASLSLSLGSVPFFFSFFFFFRKWFEGKLGDGFWTVGWPELGDGFWTA